MSSSDSSDTGSGFRAPEDVELAFYQSFSDCDAEAMMKLWANDEVVCIHPGSHAIVGYRAVMRSWAYIFEDAELPDIQINVVKRSVDDSLAVHLVEEHISTRENISAVLLATNVYRRYADGWYMVEHHGSVIQSQNETHTLQ